MSKDFGKLKNRIGETVQSLRLEGSCFEDDEQLDNVWLELQAGKPFAFGCDGNGGIYVKKAVLLEYSYKGKRNKVTLVPKFALAVLEDVEIGEENLILKTSVGDVEIKNIDDELEVTFTYNKRLQGDEAAPRA